MRDFINGKGRGTVAQPGNRFEKLSVELDPACFEEISRTDPDFVPIRPETQILEDDTKSIISKNDSPDLGFTYSLNPYRGCEHGCAYCYARPYHEYLGFNAGLDFETRIVAKKTAPELLEKELARPGWIPESLACSGVTDCYQPVERELQITRECLRVLRDFRNPVGIVTKNALVTRDIDYLQELAGWNASVVAISLTTLDQDLAGKLEPRASRPSSRLRAIRELHEAGVPVGISLAPVIPGINDYEIPAILEAARDHGARFAGFTVIRLPHGVKDIFADWLDVHFPGRKELVLGRIREMRDGKLNNSDYGTRMSGRGIIADEIRSIFTVSHRRLGFEKRSPRLSLEHFRRLTPGQPELF
ncbi:MAG: PA0069 family radical SAM protein [Verrucomicrobiales bacterium]|nr:PA0069 family radical SAM protein [Verrucomicrobiales bacterium]